MTEPDEVLNLLPVQYIKFITKRCFGIELEVSKKVTLEMLVKAVKAFDLEKECRSTEVYQQDLSNNYWHCKFDRSCGTKQNEGGWEVASYKASGVADLLKISEMGTVLKNVGAEVNSNCGYHIHVEIKDFDMINAATLVAYWMKIEPIILEILPENRRNNVYCRLLRDVKPLAEAHAKDIIDFWHRVRPTSMDNPDRRVSLNMCNFVFGAPQKKTVELRLPEGTLEEVDIKNWARLFIHFVNHCKKVSFPYNITPVTTIHDVVTILGLHNEDPFYILSKGLYETKTWFLNRVLKHSNKSSIKTEAQEFLNFIIPPPLASPILRLPEEVIPKKKRKVSIRESLNLLSEEDYWDPYEN